MFVKFLPKNCLNSKSWFLVPHLFDGGWWLVVVVVVVVGGCGWWLVVVVRMVCWLVVSD